MEWFYTCVEVYGIVYVEGIVVASVSWVVVRTYISPLHIHVYNKKRDSATVKQETDYLAPPEM